MLKKTLKVAKDLLGIALAIGVLWSVRWLKGNLGPEDPDPLIVKLALLAIPTGIAVLCFRARRNTLLEKVVGKSDYPNDDMGWAEQLLYHTVLIIIASMSILSGHIRF